MPKDCIKAEIEKPPMNDLCSMEPVYVLRRDSACTVSQRFIDPLEGHYSYKVIRIRPNPDYLQKNLNGSNTFGTMKLCSKQG